LYNEHALEREREREGKRFIVFAIAIATLEASARTLADFSPAISSCEKKEFLKSKAKVKLHFFFIVAA
jgi:hypothetical protein